MEGTNIHYPDTDKANDHSYIGNGCPQSWSEGGSTIACSTSLINTSDGETQSNGVSYNFQAVTSGLGASATTDNTNIPDSFCPLGWQLPYGGTGGDYYDKSKSWRYLLTFYTGVAAIKKYPVSTVGSGGYDFYEGFAYQFNGYGYYVTGTNNNSGAFYHLRVGKNDDPGEQIKIERKQTGDTIRCVKFSTSFHRRHGGGNTCRFDCLQR